LSDGIILCAASPWNECIVSSNSHNLFALGHCTLRSVYITMYMCVCGPCILQVPIDTACTARKERRLSLRCTDLVCIGCTASVHTWTGPLRCRFASHL